MDNFIAATALVNNLPIKTLNVRHFEREEGLVLVEHSPHTTLGANNLYSTGVTIRDNSVLEIKPPISTYAKGE